MHQLIKLVSIYRTEIVLKMLGFLYLIKYIDLVLLII